MSVSLINSISNLKVSSVLNKNAKEYGKQYMIDSCEDTCWNSAQGSPQWLQVDFNKLVSIKELHLQFQGGFAGKECWIEVEKDGKMEKTQSIYPEDTNTLQIFSIDEQISKSFKVVFNSSTDFYGRIIVYKLDILGEN